MDEPVNSVALNLDAQLRDVVRRLAEKNAEITRLREECEAQSALISGMDRRLAELDDQNVWLRRAALANPR